MCFKIDRATLIVGSKFTAFALFHFVFEGNLQVQAPGVAYIWRGDLTEDFLCYEFRGLIFGGAYTRRGLFLEFYGSCTTAVVTGKGWGDYAVSRQNSKWLSYAWYGNVTTQVAQA